MVLDFKVNARLVVGMTINFFLVSIISLPDGCSAECLSFGNMKIRARSLNFWGRRGRSLESILITC